MPLWGHHPWAQAGLWCCPSSPQGPWLGEPWQDRGADVGHPHGARGSWSVCPPQECCCLLWLVAPGGDIAPWAVLVAETLLLPSHSTKISTGSLSVNYRKRCKVSSLFFPNMTNYDSLGIREIKMPDSLQDRQEWPFCAPSEGVGSSLCRDPTSPSWPQADGEELPKGNSAFKGSVEVQGCVPRLDPEHQGNPFPFALPFPSSLTFSAVSPSSRARTRLTPRCKPPSAKQIF